MRPLSSAILICMICRSVAWSEASYQETTRITGGSITKMMSLAGAFSKNARKLEQPMVSTVAVRGNVMARDSQDMAEIIDLDARTITHIDKVKREYTVTTFQQMQEAMQRAAAKAQAERAKASSTPATGQQQQADSNVQLTFQPTVRKTNAKRQINGLDTSEVILSLAVTGSDKRTGEQAGALGVTEDMWLAPDVPGYGEVREFSQKLAKELGSSFRAAGANMTGLMAGQQAQSEQAFKDLAKEMSQIEGVPVLQVMRMGMTANGQPLPAASEVAASPTTTENGNAVSPDSSLGSQVATASATAAQQTAAQEASQKIRGALGSGLGSAIGGFGGFGGRKKKQAAASAPTTTDSATTTSQASTTAASSSSSASAPQGQAPQSAVLVESTTEMANFTQKADDRLFQIPGGFRMIPNADLKN
jgi:hypothetical protein